MSLIALILLPDTPLSAGWLSPPQRISAVERIRVNQQGIGNRTFKLLQIRELFTDPFVWCILVFSVAANIPNGGLTNFFAILVSSFGYGPRESLLLTTPAGAIGLIVILAWGISARYFQSRLFSGIACLALAMLGVILMLVLSGKARIAGFYLTMAIPAGEASIISLISSNVAGYTKKTTVSALFFVGYCVGNIVGPQTFEPADAPDYRPAEIAIITSLAVCILDMMVMYAILRHRNHSHLKREPPIFETTESPDFLDLTDREHPLFVYAL